MQVEELEMFADNLADRLEEAVEIIGQVYNESQSTLARVAMVDSLVEQIQVHWI